MAINWFRQDQQEKIDTTFGLEEKTDTSFGLKQAIFYENRNSAMRKHLFSNRTTGPA